MPIRVRVPTALRPLTGGRPVLEIEAAAVTLAEILDRLDRGYPGLRGRLVDETGDVRPGVNVYVNGEDVRFLAGLATRIDPNDEVSIVPAAAGGARRGSG